ncbi:MAG TPA: cytidine deaminase [Acidimicrobiia bacterium]|jgi:cytidine deaminase|nr:cytidine deaminase [Acidimicrobiia bacterium]
MRDRNDLIALAREAASNAYAPYSKFRVGAAVLSSDGLTYTGANVENAAYPATSCAEATAIAHAVSSGVRKIEAVAVACIDASSVAGAYPCGRCRQIMAEFGVDEVHVTAGSGSKVMTHTLDELLPFRFKF